MTVMTTSRRERGAALLMVTFLAAFLLIPLIGIGIDSAVLFWVKAKLSAAVDSAALSTARSLNVGQTLSDQETQARLVGQQYFAANFPAGFMRSSIQNGQPDIQFDDSVAHIRKVTVTAYADVPTFFMRILHFNSGTVGATGQASRRDANIILVLDRSGSMNNGSCEIMVASAENFVNKFVDGRDRLGLITFSTGANEDFAASLNFKSSTPSLNDTLAKLKCGGSTSTAQALELAYDKIRAINEPGALNAILFFTDGQPNGVLTHFPVKTLADLRYDWNPGNGKKGSDLTGNTVLTAASSCAASVDLTGTMSSNGLQDTGPTSLVIDATGVGISNTGSPAISAKNCAFPSNLAKGRLDVAYIRPTDVYGSSIDSGYNAGYGDLDRFPLTNLSYIGKIRPDTPRNVRIASFNAADSIAQTIRNNTTYGTILYTIGLNGNDPVPLNENFMERLANDPRADNYDSTPAKGQGLFILASDKGQLASAFQSIASQILRLSQ
jgi:Flp pilus assembly protein TadG